MPEFIEEETGRRLYHENETTLDIEKEIAKKFTPKKGEVTSSYMHRDMDEEEVYDCKSEPRENINKFYESLSSTQFSRVSEFFSVTFLINYKKI